MSLIRDLFIITIIIIIIIIIIVIIIVAVVIVIIALLLFELWRMKRGHFFSVTEELGRQGKITSWSSMRFWSWEILSWNLINL